MIDQSEAPPIKVFRKIGGISCDPGIGSFRIHNFRVGNQGCHIRVPHLHLRKVVACAGTASAIGVARAPRERLRPVWPCILQTSRRTSGNSGDRPASKGSRCPCRVLSKNASVYLLITCAARRVEIVPAPVKNFSGEKNGESE